MANQGGGEQLAIDVAMDDGQQLANASGNVEQLANAFDNVMFSGFCHEYAVNRGCFILENMITPKDGKTIVKNLQDGTFQFEDGSVIAKFENGSLIVNEEMAKVTVLKQECLPFGTKCRIPRGSSTTQNYCHCYTAMTNQCFDVGDIGGAVAGDRILCTLVPDSRLPQHMMSFLQGKGSKKGKGKGKVTSFYGEGDEQYSLFTANFKEGNTTVRIGHWMGGKRPRRVHSTKKLIGYVDYTTKSGLVITELDVDGQLIDENGQLIDASKDLKFDFTKNQFSAFMLELGGRWGEFQSGDLVRFSACHDGSAIDVEYFFKTQNIKGIETHPVILALKASVETLETKVDTNESASRDRHDLALERFSELEKSVSHNLTERFSELTENLVKSVNINMENAMTRTQGAMEGFLNKKLVQMESFMENERSGERTRKKKNRVQVGEGVHAEDEEEL